jgi:hypothetical protein
MLASLALFAGLTRTTQTLARFAQSLQDNIHGQSRTQINRFFDRPDRDVPYLIDMVKRGGGLKTIRVVILPAAPGWEGWGTTWAVLHTFQDCEQDHDMVMEVLQTPDGFKLGREVPQYENGGAKVERVAYHATLHPHEGTMDVEAVLRIKPSPVGWAPIFRLNDLYQIKEINHGAKILAADSGVLDPGPNFDFVRAGGVLIPWKKLPIQPQAFDLPNSPQLTGQLHLTYSGDVAHAREKRTDDQDVITNREACVASLWLPSLGQVPCPVEASITAPGNWVVRGEGDAGQTATEPDGSKTSQFDCELPISFPKVIGGLYQLAAETTEKGQPFKVFQLPPIRKEEAQNELDRMVEAAQYFQSTLAPLPFKGYELYVSEAYYGIESYSHTILAARDAFEVSHEMGHSYFGGIVPCTYVFDTWNESATQYIDSIALHKNEDKSLEAGLRTVGLPVPLSQMPVPWAYDSATYTRGAYVFRMLEDEITPKGVLAGLKALIADRAGKETRWDDLRQYFEKVSGKDLVWFWSQWVDNATFPKLTITDSSVVPVDKKFRTLVTITQSGTARPFRMRCRLVATVAGQPITKRLQLKDRETIDYIDTDAKPSEVHIEVFPDTLATVGRSKS